jgi:murein DD-endopeptidase MepM/ murein hydrolase activator NlpD
MPHASATIRTIAVTAAVTSAVWVTAGALWIDGLGGSPQRKPAVPSVAALMAAPVPLAVAAKRPSPADLLVMPVRGVTPDELSDTFTNARESGARTHDAIDILAPRGTPVVAAAAGRIEKLFLSKPGGNTVYVRSSDGTLIYYYAHLDRYARGLAEGQAVRPADLLGYVGATGNADPAAPHLHFAVLRTTPDAKWWEPSVAVNPYPLLARPGVGD